MNNPMLKKALKRGVELIQKQIDDYEDRIEAIHLKEEGDPLSLAFTIKITGSSEKLRVETGIAFTESKVKDTAADLVTSAPLFEKT